jgi:CYTH domain-containing protein
MALEIERKYLVIDESRRAGAARTSPFHQYSLIATRHDSICVPVSEDKAWP